MTSCQGSKIFWRWTNVFDRDSHLHCRMMGYRFFFWVRKSNIFCFFVFFSATFAAVFLRSRNFATMATWRLTTSPLSFHGLIIFCFSISKENRLTLKAWALIRQLQCLEGIYKVIAILENTNETKTCQSNWVGLWWKVRLFARYTPE